MHSFSRKFEIMRFLGQMALWGFGWLVLGLGILWLWPDDVRAIIIYTIATVLIVPGLVFGYILTILHWKARYRGDQSDLWGVLMIIEASGWTKVIYFLRHVLPDMRSRGRYGNLNE